MTIESCNASIGYPRACAELAANRAIHQQGMALLRGPCDVVPPLDPRVPVLVRARECVRELREESK
jgi:hypothetical protein